MNPYASPQFNDSHRASSPVCETFAFMSILLAPLVVNALFNRVSPNVGTAALLFIVGLAASCCSRDSRTMLEAAFGGLSWGLGAFVVLVIRIRLRHGREYVTRIGETLQITDERLIHLMAMSVAVLITVLVVRQIQKGFPEVS